jgi:hypothetical protein
MKLRLTQTHQAPLSLLSEVGSSDPAETRKRLMSEFRAGGLDSVRFTATVWTNGPNKNHYQFPDAELEAFAKSFAGCPFLRDHEASMAARGGTIKDSWLEKGEEGQRAIRQRIEVVKPWAIESALDGTLDRFSVGWDAQEYHCTVCEASIAECGHLYKLGQVDKKSGKKVELLWKGLEGVEVSGVTHPAAPGTTTEEVMARLATLSQQNRNAAGNSAGAEEDKMKEKVLSLLGLPAETTEPEAIAALESRLKSKAVNKALGLPEEAPEAEAVAKVLGLTAPGAVVSREEHDKVVAELHKVRAEEKVRAALAAGKLTPATAEWARDLALKNPEGFDAFIAHAPQQIPLNVPKVTAATPPNLKHGLTEDELKIATRFGCSPEEWVEAKKKVADYDARIAR